MEHGIITSVDVSDNGLPYASVVVQRAGVTYQACPIAQNFSGEVQPLNEGDHVILQETNDGLRVILGVLNLNQDRIPKDMDGQERIISFDDGTKISVRKDGSGSYNVDIESSGNVTINATGDVTIGDSANAVELAVQNHTHEYDDSTISDTDDGSGSQSSTTKTTTQPVEEGTSAKVE